MFTYLFLIFWEDTANRTLPIKTDHPSTSFLNKKENTAKQMLTESSD